MAETTSLLRTHTGNRIEGSNPSLTAITFFCNISQTRFKFKINVDIKKKWHIIRHLNAPVAQLDRAPGYELGGREFESLRARHIFLIVQSGLSATGFPVASEKNTQRDAEVR